MQRNRLMLEETRDIVTVPASMIIRMLGNFGSLIFLKILLNLDLLQLASTPTIEIITTTLIIKTTQAAHKISVQSKLLYLYIYIFSNYLYSCVLQLDY